jgi:hypothetical protein
MTNEELKLKVIDFLASQNYWEAIKYVSNNYNNTLIPSLILSRNYVDRLMTELDLARDSQGLIQEKKYCAKQILEIK